MKKILYPILLLMLCFANPLRGGHISCPIYGEKIDVFEKSEVFVDNSLKLDIDKVSQNAEVHLFSVENRKIVASRKRLAGNVWCKWTLKNTTGKDVSYSLKIADPFINHLHLYESSTENGGGHFLGKSGSCYPYAVREINYREHIFPIHVPAHSHLTYYLMMDKYGKALRLNMELWQTEKLFEKLYSNNFSIGILYGILLVFLLIAMVLFIQFRRRFFLGYIAYLIGGLLFSLSNSGILFQYVLGAFPGRIVDLPRPWALFIASIGLVSFAHYLFNHPIQSKSLDRTRRVYNITYSSVFVIGSLLYFFIAKAHFGWFVPLFSISGASLSSLGILLSLSIILHYYLKNKNLEALVLFVAYIILFLYMTVFYVNTFFYKFLYHPFLLENNGLIILIMEAFVMSIVISIRINNILKKREELKRQVEKQKLELANSLIRGEENERKRVSKELHDGIGSYLSTIGLYVDQIKDGSPLKSKIREMVNEAHEETRRISNDLMPEAFERFGLLASIENLCHDLNESQKIKTRFITNLGKPRLSTAQQLNVFRIVQELANNTLKHANASELTIQLLHYKNTLTLSVEDNGEGIDMEALIKQKPKAFYSIKSRVNSLDAKLNIDSSVAGGTTIVVEISI